MVCDVLLFIYLFKENLPRYIARAVSGFLHCYMTGGKIGFYYKDHEILPPLPGLFLVLF